MTFEELNIRPEIMKAIRKAGYGEPTGVQAGAIPPLMEGRDVTAKAPTGTGKTVAFAVPLLERVDLENPAVQAVILCPTRELALQITDEIRKLSAFMPGVKIAAIYGGQNINRQIDALKKKPQIVVATPGRLLDHMTRKTIDLRGVTAIVLDEADRMLDMGFVNDVRRLLESMPNRRQVIMMSATISREVMDIGWVYQRDPVELEVEEVEDDKPPIEQYFIETRYSSKLSDIMEIMALYGYKRCIIFCNTKNMVKRLTHILQGRGYSAECIHGDMRQASREKVMKDFKAGKYNVLLATDVAARGLDIEGVDAVFNHDLPDENEYYLHRIGRTGRAKHHGVSYTLVSEYDIMRLDELIRYTREEMTPLKWSDDRQLVPVHPAG